jgi:hypothetical protein
VFSNFPCRETPKNALKKKKKKYALCFASWRRCTSFSRFIFSAAPSRAPLVFGVRGVVGKKVVSKKQKDQKQKAKPKSEIQTRSQSQLNARCAMRASQFAGFWYAL